MFAKIKQWFKTRKALHEQNVKLAAQALDAQVLASSIHRTLAFDHEVSERTIRYLVNNLGAIALQFNGEITIKKDFLQMMLDDDKLDVKFSQNENQEVVITVEATQEEEATPNAESESE